MKTDPTQFIFNLESGHSIRLPPLTTGPIKLSCGFAHQMLRQEEVANIKALIPAPPRIEGAKAYLLEDGRTFLQIEKSAYNGQLQWEGILVGNAESRWIQHRMLDEHSKMWAEGLDTIRVLVRDSWKNAFRFRSESLSSDGSREQGLRPPQIGALHAIGAHWSLSSEPAIVVMPTGTGKTETMLAAMIAYRPECLLIVVPSDALRQQIANKFLTLGVLEQEECIDSRVLRPLVGIIRNQIKNEEDLEIFHRCNVVIATASSIAQGRSVAFLKAIAGACSHLIFDEAHHVPASSWSCLKEAFAGKPVLQFTATPYRSDGALIQGVRIYNYPLNRALKDGYFKRVRFRSVFYFDKDDADTAIAEKAISQLRVDLAAGYNHRLMVRCQNTVRANTLGKMYEQMAGDLNPIVIHSKVKDTASKIEKIRAGDHKIVVCVHMLAEGFDMPELKIAAAHDKHQSLAPLLQFVGRLSRVTGMNLGEATFITNAARQPKGELLTRLYSEDADWEELLGDIHAEVTDREERMRQLVRATQSIHELPDMGQGSRISITTLQPKHSAVIRLASRFEPEMLLQTMLDTKVTVRGCFLNSEENFLVVVTNASLPVKWMAGDPIREDRWELCIVHYDPSRRLLFIHSSEEGDLRPEWIKAVSGDTAIDIPNEGIFRVFGNLTRLLLVQAGLKKKGGGMKHRYSMLTGQDVSAAISSLEARNAVRSNFFGHGYTGGRPYNYGASAKGKVWSHSTGRITDFLGWCSRVGEKVLDVEISPDTVFKHAIRPEKVQHFPNETVLHAIWPEELSFGGDDGVTLKLGTMSPVPFMVCGLEYASISPDRSMIEFKVTTDNWTVGLRMQISDDYDRGFAFSHPGGDPIVLHKGRREWRLTEYLNEYPPSVLLVSGAEMVGALLYPVPGFGSTFADDQIRIIDWAGTDIQRESIWKDGEWGKHSVQWRAFERTCDESWDVVMDDDGSGEAADLVCIRRDPKRILVRLIHCKFSVKPETGDRLKDAVDVASQATRSVHWTWKFEKLCRHLLRRAERREKHGAPSLSRVTIITGNRV